MTGAGAVAVMVAITALSLFYRSCLGVIAPELTRDLGLTPEDLGNANGVLAGRNVINQSRSLSVERTSSRL